jgi:hypothetical protein
MSGAAGTSSSSLRGGASAPIAGSSAASLASSAVEDIVYLRSLDLFITCVGDNHMFFWDLRGGQLKMQFCTNLQPEECLLSLASGEDSAPFVSYDTALSKKGAATANNNGGVSFTGAGGGGVSLKNIIKKRNQAGANGGILGVKGTIKSFAKLIEEALMLRDDGSLGLVVTTDGIGDAQTGYVTDNLVDDEERRQQAVLNKQKQEHATANLNASSQHRLLIAGCDWGFVYVWDVSRLPPSTAPASAFLGGVPLTTGGSLPPQAAAASSAVYAPPVLLSVFRAHNAPITRLSFFDSERLLCTMSSVDCYVKTFHLKGSYVGHFGQRTPYWFRDATTFGADAFSVAMDDKSQQTPRYPPPSAPSTAASHLSSSVAPKAAGRRRASGQSSPMPGITTAVLQAPRDTPSVPITASAIAGGAAASRPATRQLDSPAASLFNSSFFATAVPKTILGNVESHEMSSFAQVPAGIDVFEGAVSGGGDGVASPSFAESIGGSKVAFPLPAKRRSSFGASQDVSNRSPHALDSDRATPAGALQFGASVNNNNGKWTSPTSVLTEEEFQAAKELSRSVAPRGLTNKEGEANLRPLLYRKKRLSIRATSTETLEEIRQRKPRHTASIVGDVHMFLKSSPQGDNVEADHIQTPGEGGRGRRRTFGRRRTSQEGDIAADGNGGLGGAISAFVSKRRSSRSSSPQQSLEPLNVPVFLSEAEVSAAGSPKRLPLLHPQQHQQRFTPPQGAITNQDRVQGASTTQEVMPHQSLLIPPPALRSLRTKSPRFSDGGGSVGQPSPMLTSQDMYPHVSTTGTPSSPGMPLLVQTPGRLGGTPGRLGMQTPSTRPPPSPKFDSAIGGGGGGLFLTPRAFVAAGVGKGSPQPALSTLTAGNDDPLAGSFGAKRKPPLAPASPVGHGIASGNTQYLLQPVSNTSSAFVTPRGPDHHHHGTPPSNAYIEDGTPPDMHDISGIPLLKRPPYAACDGDYDGFMDGDGMFGQWSIAAGGDGTLGGGGGGFLLTALEGGDDDDDDGVASARIRCNEEISRSHSVPLTRRLPVNVSVLARSSEKYRSRTSLSMLPTAATSGLDATTPAGGPLQQSGKSVFGSPAASYASFPSSSPVPSPSSSPRRRTHFVSGLDRSAVHKATAILHNAAVAHNNRRSETEHRVDRVTRLIRDRELLKYQPVMIRSSLLQDNDSMRDEVAIMPSAWTTRASSLLKTHDFELQDIQRRFWSPKGKEISKAKLLKWNTDSNSLFGADPRKQQQQQQQQSQQSQFHQQ